jgi:hypothetical protein
MASEVIGKAGTVWGMGGASVAVEEWAPDAAEETTRRLVPVCDDDAKRSDEAEEEGEEDGDEFEDEDEFEDDEDSFFEDEDGEDDLDGDSDEDEDEDF